MAEYVSKETLLKAVEKIDRLDKETNTKYEYDKQGYILLIENAPTADVAEVVYCNECVKHNNCIFEDTFNTTGLADEHRYCGVGKWKENEINKTDYEMALSVLKNLEAEQNTPHILIGIAFAKAAVEKQIPKKPTDIKLEYDGNYGKCPCCGESVMDFDEYTRCKKCGQALKWKEEDNDL